MRVTLDGGAGNDVVLINADTSEGQSNGFGSVRDHVTAGDGNDVVRIGAVGITNLDSAVAGGRGDDILDVSATAYAFSDPGLLASSLFGNDGNDILSVSLAGNPDRITFSSLLDGGAGNDTLVGSAVGDTLIGGAGADQMTGGGGNDAFVLGKDSGAARDVITDFTTGGDHIDLGAFSLDLAGLQALIAASSGDRLALSSIGGRDVTLAGLDVHDLSASDFIL